MKTSLFALIAMSVVASGSANAGTQTLTFADFKSACTNPSQFHNQVAPTNIQITCRDVHTRWVSDQQAAIALPATRDVTTSLASDKYIVNAATVPMVQEPASLSCTTFKEILETVETSRSLTCDEVLAFKGSPTELCISTIATLISGNKEAVNIVDTGKKLNPCGPQGTTAQPQQEAVKK